MELCIQLTWNQARKLKNEIEYQLKDPKAQHVFIPSSYLVAPILNSIKKAKKDISKMR